MYAISGVDVLGPASGASIVRVARVNVGWPIYGNSEAPTSTVYVGALPATLVWMPCCAASGPVKRLTIVAVAAVAVVTEPTVELPVTSRVADARGPSPSGAA